MPRGYVKLEDGSMTKLWSQEHRALLASKKLQKVLSEKIKTDVDGAEATVTFSPPPPSIGVPKKDPEPPKGKTKSKKEEQADEIEDYKQLIAAFFYGIAVATGTPEYKFSESEAEAAAKPLARIVARNTRVRKVVQQVADPIALVGAVAFPLMVKHAAAEKRKKTPTMQAPSQAPVNNVQTQRTEGPPPPPKRGVTPNGTVPMETVLSRISEGS